MRTQLSNWQIKAIGERDQMKYAAVNHTTVAHLNGEVVTYRIPFPTGVEGFMVKTIRVTSQENIEFVISLMDGNTDHAIYESLNEIKLQYDQVDIPYKPSEQAFFVRLHNKGTIPTKFTIDIRGIEVK